MILGLLLIAVVLANSYFSGVEAEQERIAQQNEVARIVVATQPLDFGTALTTENTRMQNFPANSVPTGAFFSIDELVQGVDAIETSTRETEALERVCILFDGGDGAAVQAARGQWKALTSAGCKAQYWSEESGRWEKK